MSSDRAVRRFGTRTGNRTHGIFLILLYSQLLGLARRPSPYGLGHPLCRETVKRAWLPCGQGDLGLHTQWFYGSAGWAVFRFRLRAEPNR